MEAHNTIPLIARRSFSAGALFVKRWTRFLERGAMVSRRINDGLAMEDLTKVKGVAIESARKLARAGIATFERLRSATPGELRDAGLSSPVIGFVKKWQAAQKIPASGPEEAKISGPEETKGRAKRKRKK